MEYPEFQTGIFGRMESAPKVQYAHRTLISLLFLSKMVELLADYENLVCTSQHTDNINDHSVAFWGK